MSDTINLDRLIDQLQGDEGFRPYVYDDETGEPIVPGYKVVGHPTIWWGLCVEIGRAPEIPASLTRMILEHVAGAKWKSLIARAPWLATQPAVVQVALANMAYQLGVEGVLRFTEMILALKRGERELAAAHGLDSKWARKTPERAERVMALVRGKP